MLFARIAFKSLVFLLTPIAKTGGKVRVAIKLIASKLDLAIDS